MIWARPSRHNCVRIAQLALHALHDPRFQARIERLAVECDEQLEGTLRAQPSEHTTRGACARGKHTQRGDICFEPFSGSGSQLVAAEGLARRCYAMELEPVFVDVAVRRWQTLTGREAVLEASGQTWQQAFNERGGEAAGSEKRRRGAAAPQRAAAGPH